MTVLQGYQHIELRQLDLLSEDSIRCGGGGGGVDVLVDNAGMPCTAPLAEVPLAMVDTVFPRTNYLGPVMLIQAVVQHMVAKGKGKIVNVGSISSFAAGPFAGVYIAFKAALQRSTDAVR